MDLKPYRYSAVTAYINPSESTLREILACEYMSVLNVQEFTCYVDSRPNQWYRNIQSRQYSSV